VFGDIEKGNGDKSLVMFRPDVTPNQHKLAEEFVLLDNFYATGGNSADGHQWLTQANEVDYCNVARVRGRNYPYDGRIRSPIRKTDSCGTTRWGAERRYAIMANMPGPRRFRLRTGRSSCSAGRRATTSRTIGIRKRPSRRSQHPGEELSGLERKHPDVARHGFFWTT